MRTLTVLLVGLSLTIVQSSDSFARAPNLGTCITHCYEGDQGDPNRQNRCILRCIDAYNPRVSIEPIATGPDTDPKKLAGINIGSVQIGPMTPIEPKTPKFAAQTLAGAQVHLGSLQ